MSYWNFSEVAILVPKVSSIRLYAWGVIMGSHHLYAWAVSFKDEFCTSEYAPQLNWD